MEWRKTTNFDGSPLRLPGMAPGDEETVEEVGVPEFNKDTPVAILP